MNHNYRLGKTALYLACLAIANIAASAGTLTVKTVAGGYVGDGPSALAASFSLPNGVARAANGTIYVSDSSHCRIRKISPAGAISTFAGTGICGYSGDGGAAQSARISNAYGISLDRWGNLFIADEVNSRIRKITPRGIITTVAGNGTYGYSGDGGSATQASLADPLWVFVDPVGKLYIADTSNNVIRMVDTAGLIHTVAGNGIEGFSGDGGPATSASLSFPWGVVADGAGVFYIADENSRIRRVDSSGTINTYAGNGLAGNSGSGGPATSASIAQPTGLLLGGGKLYLSTYSNLVWAVDLATQIITITAGNGLPGFNGDGNSALLTSFAQPDGLAFDGTGGLFIVDSGNNRLRHVDASQVVTTAAGGYVGDGGHATQAGLNFSEAYPHLTFDAAGNMYIADLGSCLIRKVTRTGTISTVAGNGVCGYSGDGGLATAATLSFPQAAVADGNGNIFIADTGNNVIRKVDTEGTISTSLTSFDGSFPAIAVALAIDNDGNLYACDGFQAIWKIDPSNSATIVAGELFALGYNGDGILATQAWLDFPQGVAVDRLGNLYIDDWLNERVRKVDTSGIISTVAGNGIEGFTGDGGPATLASLNLPLDVAVDGKGNIYVADWLNLRVRMVDSSGVIRTMAGSGIFGYNGEGLAAGQTNLFPVGVAVSPGGTVYFADRGSYRVRRIQ